MYKKNKALLSKILPKIQKEGIENIINGASIPAQSRDTFDNHSPVDGAFMGKVAKSNAADVDMAAKAAAEAFKAWRSIPHKEPKRYTVCHCRKN